MKRTTHSMLYLLFILYLSLIPIVARLFVHSQVRNILCIRMRVGFRISIVPRSNRGLAEWVQQMVHQRVQADKVPDHRKCVQFLHRPGNEEIHAMVWEGGGFRVRPGLAASSNCYCTLMCTMRNEMVQKYFGMYKCSWQIVLIFFAPLGVWRTNIHRYILHLFY